MKHPIVGIGASAGGIPAREGFFRALADESGMGIVIVTHLSPDRRSRLDEIIALQTSMPVRIARDGAEVLPNTVHVMPKGKILTIRDGRPATPRRRSDASRAQADRRVLRLARRRPARECHRLVNKEVREMCIFSPHSVISDPPFSRMDLVSCRNLLIYLGGDLQSRVIPTFHYALKPGGFLFLGTSEGVSRHRDLFVPLDKQHRIFQSRDLGGAPRRMPVALVVEDD